MVERSPYKADVAGSIPVPPKKQAKGKSESHEAIGKSERRDKKL